MEIKKKDMKKSGWTRCLEKEYYFKEFIFNQFSGVASLSILKKVESPLIINYNFGDVLIADDNYKLLQLAFKNEKFWLTAAYDNYDNFIQLYFDITNGNYFEDISNPYFYDLFLDVVVTKDRKIYVIDKDDLELALTNKVINSEEYNNANKTCENLCNYLEVNKEDIIDFCTKMLKNMSRNV